MYRLHDALGHRARPSRRAHARRLGITPAGARSHTLSPLRRSVSVGRPAKESGSPSAAITPPLGWLQERPTERRAGTRCGVARLSRFWV
eukprot:scaffold81557_cov51-Phaeocystis_antarctica.AAC.3